MTDLRPFRFKVCVYDHIIDVSDSSATAYTNYVCIIYIYILFILFYIDVCVLSTSPSF